MNELSIIIGVIVVGFLIALFFIRKWITEFHNQSKPSDEIVEWLKDVSTRVETSTKHFNERLDRSAHVIAQVQKNIGEFSEIGRGMKGLQEFLQSPKLRGNIGEHVLKDLLAQCLPKSSYQTQYSFRSGDKVDAVIKTSKGIVPVDAKFPMENFQKMISEEYERDRNKFKKEFIKNVKKHINDISKKYIKVQEGTLDYALMYIPSESVFYEIINSRTLYSFARSHGVIVVSPMSFYAYLKAILMSYEGQKIEKRAEEILAQLRSLKKDYEKADQALSVLNRHITNAYNQIANVSRVFLGFGQKLDSTRVLEGKKDSKILE